MKVSCKISFMKKIILASKSPRRKELLEKCGIEFECMPMNIDESLNEGDTLEEKIRILSQRKASACLAAYPDAVVIGSDTIVTVDEKILGKPKNREEAKEMLRELSGRTHRVITGLCIISSARTYTDVSVSEVTFAPLSEEEIDSYTESGECDDKAGSYAIQGLGGKFITHISGDYYAIMGLPLNLVYEELKNIDLY